ncbi:MAG TPA: SAM-dependent methyltransferase [Streptosporangiaceae bacterium]|jgi:DNA-binding SARP family transcriptional activator
MEFRVLRSRLEVLDDWDKPVPIPQSLIRAAISALVLHEGVPLWRTELMDLIWPHPPTGGALRTCIYDVRHVIGTQRLVWESGTYRFVLGESDRTDLAEFRATVAAAEAALRRGERASAAELLTQALKLWDNHPLRDLSDTPAATEAAESVVEELRQARDMLVAIRIELGHHHDLVDVLNGIVEAEPLNEEVWGQLMLALYLTGRPAEALHAYYRARAALEDAGVEPDEHLQQLRRQIQARDPALGWSGVTLGRPMAAKHWSPTDFKTDVPHPARVYDYLLGGKDNFVADRQVAERLIAGNPQIVWLTRQNRQFLLRVVRFLAAGCGIRQFIDIGSGLPTQNNVHEVARTVISDARVVYVDNDPMVSAHGRALLASDPHTAFVKADLRHPAEIINDPETRRVINFTKPVALLLFAILHFVADDDAPHDHVTQLRDVLTPDSYLALSHGAPADDKRIRELSREAFENATTQLWVRPPDTIARFFDGFELLPPGLVPITAWRPESSRPRPTRLFGGVGRLRS